MKVVGTRLDVTKVSAGPARNNACDATACLTDG